MQWMTVFSKELLEDWRSYKWIWVPLVFILLCIMDPLSSYYLPQILEAVGGLPDGTVIEMPETLPEEALMMSLAQLSMIGVMIIAAITMGVIAGERKSGVAELVLVKPIPYLTYITAKWAAKLLLIFSSYLLGMLASWYYVNLLFGEISFLKFMGVFFFYFIWLAFVTTLSVFYNTTVKVPGLVISYTLLTLIVMSVLYKIFAHIMPWFPNSISTHLMRFVMENNIPGELWGAAGITAVLSVILLVLSNYVFKTKEMAD
ncbi:ABC-2 type transport system permease protein [Gracilibacillus ureilyticus]|uniref:ABC-2 type transport system permease protein n=1 Tax=Gracilibacillus ureilyticus TaxID=531814 RepID=A0A1H9QDH0_9BACI|nr:ABC transporter permease [Gracilibacillus ureilyticus]SER58215.1 ABC-2 type transport system permease protein [Gracilibacillus ureilyticus]